jgi:hypothetical protein
MFYPEREKRAASHRPKMRCSQARLASETWRSSASHKEVGQPSSCRVDTQISWEKINYKADEDQLNTGMQLHGVYQTLYKTRGAGSKASSLTLPFLQATSRESGRASVLPKAHNMTTT